MDPDAARAEATAAGERSAGLLAALAERIGASASASAVFGEPVEREGVTVIPVARASWGFGGGSGGEPPNEGAGGGGGSLVTPIGYIEIRADGAEFKPLHDRARALALLGLAAGAVGLAARARRRHGRAGR